MKESMQVPVCKEAYKKSGEELSTRACCRRTRGNCLKLKEGRFALKVSYTGCGEALEQVPREVVDAPSLEVLKTRLVGALSNLV